jgi:hypothetical protein
MAIHASIEPGMPHIGSRTGNRVLALARISTMSATAVEGERRRRPKPFWIKLCKRIADDFINRCRDLI